MFRNILNELGHQKANFKHYKNTKETKNSININFDNDYHQTMNVEEKRVKDIVSKPVLSRAGSYDLSFSCILKDRLNYFKGQKLQTNQTIKKDRTLTTQMYSNKNHSLFFFSEEGPRNITQNLEKASISTLTENEDQDSTFKFAPPFVSTPKKSKTLRSTSILQSVHQSFSKLSRCKRKYNKQTRINKDKIIKRILLESKQVRNKSLGAKFIDILNGSCTTLVKSFTCFKNIFRSKESSTSRDEDVNKSRTTNFNLPSNTFTNYMHNRDAHTDHRSKNKDGTFFNTEFSIEDDKFHLQECNTCNDTIILQQKFKNDLKLQRTVKKLKFGINLYGCDFKVFLKIFMFQVLNNFNDCDLCIYKSSYSLFPILTWPLSEKNNGFFV